MIIDNRYISVYEKIHILVMGYILRINILNETLITT